MNRPVVTVDGPAGSGKTTLGRALAEVLGLPLIDTGLFYRGIMVAALRAGVADDGDDQDLGAIARRTSIAIGTDPAAAEQTVMVNGLTAGSLLRDPSHAALLARVSRTPAVRAAVLEPQRALALDGAVAVGRDCGTVVFPDATVKFYLDAPLAVRERRRLAQLREAGAEAGDVTIQAEVADRDRSDTDRVTSPLRPAPDAVVIDTASAGIEAMIRAALEICRGAGLGMGNAP